MISVLKHPSAWIPIALSVGILGMLLFFILTWGVVHETDEGTAAHLFQIWLVIEVVMITFFAAKWLPQAPKQALLILTIQILAVVGTCVPVFILNL